MYRQRWIVVTLCSVALITTLCNDAAKAAYIQGSGTTGRISKFTGTSTIGNSVLFETGGNVGIGTTDPGTAKLFVNGAAAGVAPNIMTNGDIVIGPMGAIFFNNLHWYGAGDYIMPTAGYGTLGFFTSGVERIRIISNGNVGVGTTAPTQKLEVAGTIYSTSGGFKFPDGSVQTTAITGGGPGQGGWVDTGTTVVLTTDTDIVGIGTNSPQGTLHVRSNNPSVSNPLQLETSSPGLVLCMKDSLTTATYGNALARIGDNLELRTLDTPRVIVAPDGKVIVGGAPWDTGTHQLTIDADATGIWACDDGNAQLVLRGKTDTTLRVAVGVDTTSGKGRIQAGDVGVAPIDLLLQPAGGNVGIGTTSPTAKLQVAGTIHSTVDGFKFPDGTVQTTAATGGGGGGGGWVDSGTNVILETTTDLVGIGTTTPSRELTVRGNILIERVLDGTPVMEFGEGLDYAEGFDVTDEAAPAPGSVLVIDTDNPGRLTLSTKPYDSRVAGIVAGAKGLGSAVRLGVGQFDCDVALAGRVYCNVDATESAVQPGDLLTTSATAGWAMKAIDPGLTHGATLGKAMQGLEKGQKGQILVLVTLQ